MKDIVFTDDITVDALYVYTSLAKAVASSKKHKAVLVIGSKKEISSLSQKAKAKGILTLCQSEGYLFDKFVLERTSVDIMFDFELLHAKDHLHYRRSGLNQVLCKIAHDNGKMIAFSFRSLLNSKNKALLLGRMMQNVRFCRKYKVKTLLASFAKNEYEVRKDLIALKRVLSKS